MKHMITNVDLRSRPGTRPLSSARSRSGRTADAIAGVAYAPDGRTLVTAGAKDGCVKVWDLRRAPAGKSTSKSGGAPWTPLGRGERSTPRRRRGGTLAERVTPMLHSYSLLAGEFDSATRCVFIYRYILNEFC